jgi:Domain of unknown function (DUF1905)
VPESSRRGTRYGNPGPRCTEPALVCTAVGFRGCRDTRRPASPVRKEFRNGVLSGRLGVDASPAARHLRLPRQIREPMRAPSRKQVRLYGGPSALRVATSKPAGDPEPSRWRTSLLAAQGRLPLNGIEMLAAARKRERLTSPSGDESRRVQESERVMLREFDAQLQKGDNTGAWTCVLMDDVAELFGTRGLVKVRGEIDGEPFTGALMAQGDGTHRLPVRAAVRKTIRKEAGDAVRVRIDERIG